jgi:cytoplasmic iron level regulating protein YaaA (DUF328/UPF0246 family)
LQTLIRTHTYTHLINLASHEYSQAINFNALPIPIVTPHFLDKKNDHYKIISFYAKRARGLMVRWAAQQQHQGTLRKEQLLHFTSENYRFESQCSTDTTWYFIRD